MRLFGILLIFCFTFGAVSAFSFGNFHIQLPSWLTSFFNSAQTTLINKVCLYLAQNPTRADSAIQKANETLHKYNETEQFTATINYLNSADNEQKLIGGTSTCPTYFSGLEQAIQTDLQNNNITLADAKQRASDLVTNFLNKMN